MNYTQKYQLCQWEETDRILRTDFNADNAKLDGLLNIRNCKAHIQSYVGTGTKSCTHTFPSKPYFIEITGGSGLTVMIQGGARGYHIYSLQAQRNPDLVWSGNSVTASSDNAAYISNSPTLAYTVLALLEADA